MSHERNAHRHRFIPPVPARSMAWPRAPANLEALGYSERNERDAHGAAFTQRAVFPHLGEELVICAESPTAPECGRFSEGGPTWLHPSAFCSLRLRIRVGQTWCGITLGQRGDFYAVGTSPLSGTYDWTVIAPLFTQSHAHVLITARDAVHDTAHSRPVRAFELAIPDDDPIVQAARAGALAGGRVVIDLHVARQPERPFRLPRVCDPAAYLDEWEAWQQARTARIWRVYELASRLPHLLETDRAGLRALGALIRLHEGDDGLELAARAALEHHKDCEVLAFLLVNFWGVDLD